MGKLLKIELKRSLFNKWTVIAFLCTLVFCVLHFADVYKLRMDYFSACDELGFTVMKEICESTPYDMWILFHKNYYSYMLLFIMPILAVMPYGTSYYSDLKSGYIKQMISRASAKSYARMKYVATFISGGTVIVLPLIIEFVALATIYPLHKPFRFNGSMMGEENFGIDLFYEHPMLYTLMRLLFVFAVAGLLATVALLVSKYVSGFFNTFITPFVVSFVFVFLSYITTKNELAFMNSLQACSVGSYNYMYLFVQIIIMFLCTYFGFVRSKKEVY